MAHLAVIISTLTCTGHNSVNLFALFTARLHQLPAVILSTILMKTFLIFQQVNESPETLKYLWYVDNLCQIVVNYDFII